MKTCVVAIVIACSVSLSAQTTGPQTVVVVPVSAPNLPSQPFSFTQMTTHFAEVEATFRVWSYGAVGAWTTTVLPWGMSPTPFVFSGCSESSVIAWAKEWALVNGHVIGTSPPAGGRGVIVTGSKLPDCGAIGMSNTSRTLPSLSRLYGSLSVALHELGHAFGLPHVDDPISIMAAGGGPGHPGVLEKRWLRWIDAPGTPRLLPVTEPGTYVIETSDGMPTVNGVVGLRFATADAWLTAEALFSGSSARTLIQGVVFRAAPLLSGMVDTPNPFANSWLATRTVGQLFTWEHVAVTVESLGPQGAVLNVLFCPDLCTPVPPPIPCTGRNCDPTPPQPCEGRNCNPSPPVGERGPRP